MRDCLLLLSHNKNVFSFHFISYSWKLFPSIKFNPRNISLYQNYFQRRRQLSFRFKILEKIPFLGNLYWQKKYKDILFLSACFIQNFTFSYSVCATGPDGALPPPLSKLSSWIKNLIPQLTELFLGIEKSDLPNPLYLSAGVVLENRFLFSFTKRQKRKLLPWLISNT